MHILLYSGRITELSMGTDLEILRNRAQNQQLVWRKGVNAIIEEYKRKWTERENKRTRYNPAQGRERQAVARRGPGCPRGRLQVQVQKIITEYFGRMRSQN